MLLLWAVILLVGLVLFFAFHAGLRWWSAHTGTANESGPYYGFFSGFGSDLGEVTLVAGLFAFFRHSNCHVKGCLRFGKPVEGTPYRACHKHHPAHEGEKRNVSIETIHEMFHRNRL